MTTLITYFGLELGDLVVAKVRAYNSIGNGEYSEPNILGATIQTKPEAMTTPYLGSDITISQLEI